MTDGADKVIAAAAKVHLAPLGLRRKGRSRTWIDDHGWWLINVEFQPASYAKGCYLNVGTQHLWVKRGYLCLDDVERPLGAAAFVEFTGDETTFAAAMTDVVGAVVAAVVDRRTRHGEGIDALRYVATEADDLDGGIAAAVLGDASRARFRLGGQIHSAFQSIAAEYSRIDMVAARAKASNAIEEERSALRLPPLSAPVPW